MNQIEIAHGNRTRAVDVWPTGQNIETLVRDPTILVTTFTDTADYHPALIEGILEFEGHPDYSHRPTMGGTKIKHLERWGFPAADLIHRRALTFFSQATGNPNPLVVDLVWANVSRQHEYLGPHSHTRATGSVVYYVEPGDDMAEFPLNGKLSFCDPRIAGCCPDEPGCMTREFLPHTPAGTMLLFPSQLVHLVHPYLGDTPRITIAWNIR